MRSGLLQAERRRHEARCENSTVYCVRRTPFRPSALAQLAEGLAWASLAKNLLNSIKKIAWTEQISKKRTSFSSTSNYHVCMKFSIFRVCSWVHLCQIPLCTVKVQVAPLSIDIFPWLFQNILDVHVSCIACCQDKSNTQLGKLCTSSVLNTSTWQLCQH